MLKGKHAQAEKMVGVKNGGASSSLPVELLNRIGNTPLVRIRHIQNPSSAVKIYAKLEWFNPGGSIKDRAAYFMVKDAEEKGLLKPGKIILEATSGNTGIALAMLGALKGYRVKLCLPESASRERKTILQAYGAEIVYTSPLDMSDGAIRCARKLYEECPDTYFYPDQYSNEQNVKAHYETTGVEIWEQTKGSVTHFVAGIGTSGTLMGVGKRLREHNPKVKIISMQPDSSLHGLEGLKHMPSSMQPAFYVPNFADENLFVSTEEAYEYVVRLAQEEGLFVGISSGAAMAACMKVAREMRDGVIVTVFPDAGDRYLEFFEKFLFKMKSSSEK